MTAQHTVHNVSASRQINSMRRNHPYSNGHSRNNSNSNNGLLVLLVINAHNPLSTAATNGALMEIGTQTPKPADVARSNAQSVLMCCNPPEMTHPEGLAQRSTQDCPVSVTDTTAIPADCNRTGLARAQGSVKMVPHNRGRPPDRVRARSQELARWQQHKVESHVIACKSDVSTTCLFCQNSYICSPASQLNLRTGFQPRIVT